MTDEQRDVWSELTQEERDYLANSTVCRMCGHLNALHNYHCCIFCLVCTP
jgi:hypothetical protein